MENMEKSLFSTLRAINCNEHTERKNNLTYLSWAWAWDEFKQNCPTATYTVHENADGWNYFTDGRTCWVKTSVKYKDEEHTLTLPVMDFKNNSIPVDRVTSFDVNKAIMRCLTKTLAMFGLGLYIYAGEDLPEDAEEEPARPKKAQNASEAPKAAKTSKNTTKATNEQEEAPATQIEAPANQDDVAAARLHQLEVAIEGTGANIDDIINWAQKKIHKSIKVATEEEFQFILNKIEESKAKKQ